jgi:hypothetical protein
LTAWAGGLAFAPAALVGPTESARSGPLKMPVRGVRGGGFGPLIDDIALFSPQSLRVYVRPMITFLLALLCSAAIQLLLLFAFAFDGTWLSLLLLFGALTLMFA